MPGSSAVMLAVTMVAGEQAATSVRMPIGCHGVAVPVGRVQVDLVPMPIRYQRMLALRAHARAESRAVRCRRRSR